MTIKQPAEEIFPLPAAILGDPDPDPCFLMKVRDDRMARAGVYAGDWLIVREKVRPRCSHHDGRSGQPAVVMENGDAVVKPGREADAPGTTFVGSAIAVLRRF